MNASETLTFHRDNEMWEGKGRRERKKERTIERERERKILNTLNNENMVYEEDNNDERESVKNDVEMGPH